MRYLVADGRVIDDMSNGNRTWFLDKAVTGIYNRIIKTGSGEYFHIKSDGSAEAMDPKRVAQHLLLANLELPEDIGCYNGLLVG